MKNDYKNLLNKNGVISFTPGGESMWPIIRNKKTTVIIVKPESELKKYDVAFYETSEGRPILHRVMSVGEDAYDMCGDGNSVYEKNVPKAAVFGILKGFYRKEKYIDCEKNFIYKLSVRIWCSSLFFRKVILKLHRIKISK